MTPASQRPWRTLLAVAALLCAAASLASWFFFFALYWPYRERFNEAGRYLDETTLAVYHEQSGLLAVPASAFALLAVLLGLAWRARCRPGVGG